MLHVLMMVTATLGWAGDRMNNGGGDREWLLNHYRTDLTATATRCGISAACSEALAPLLSDRDFRAGVAFLQNGIRFSFEGLPELPACLNRGQAISDGEGPMVFRVCVPALYELEREELPAAFAAQVFRELSRRLNLRAPGDSAVRLWAAQAVQSLATGEQAGLRWHASRAETDFSDLILARGPVATVPLVSQLREEEICDGAASAKGESFVLTSWYVQLVGPEHWVASVDFSMTCPAGSRDRGYRAEALWDVTRASDMSGLRTRLKLRGIRPF